ncbi:hypothetical protein SCATT_p01390 (plasmid) [Streptantibioticus cattleyicolor NRRL 8057 = DSM 46488]|uniref:Uncharacterized protein n=1 Tax=Streptantibioticus cattleyicolor (strain ATCC 35852 / DSM 46488 / JCM 4925 / NBRC 14057 / NRRL 8057) TaxID=1003195 RepID=G8XE69_STREN|nr:hypothetical protein SCATT_p01390 [Streptantibioticus cattleyicolor NRRL 8057 = DSM 46488]
MFRRLCRTLPGNTTVAWHGRPGKARSTLVTPAPPWPSRGCDLEHR